MSTYAQLAQHLEVKQYTWLVTGCAGFIGCNIALRLLDLKQKVVGVDNFITGLKCNIEEISSRNNSDFKFLETDIRDAKQMAAALQGVDYVIHQAALGSVPRSLKDPIASHSCNVNGFIELLWQSHLAKVKKFVYASSSSVYGTDTHLPKTEERIGSPMSPYAATKRIDEIYAETFSRSYQTPVVGLRYFNVFGPRQNPDGPYAAVIPIWIRSMLDGSDVFINGDGTNSRDFCFIENVIQANLLAAHSGTEANGQVFNIAFENRTDLKTLFLHLRNNLIELSPNLKIAPAIHRASREGDVPHSLADVSKAKKILGYQPVVGVEEGLKKTVEYFFKQTQKG